MAGTAVGWGDGAVAIASGRPERLALPRLTRAVFTDLALWMVGFGIIVGGVFPFFVMMLGVEAPRALTAPFFGATVLAGLLVGGINWWLARLVIGTRLRVLVDGMQNVAGAVYHATETGDWSGCQEDHCKLTLDSDDELGKSAHAFNELVTALAHSISVEAGLRDLFQALSNHLQTDLLADAALAWVTEHVGATAAALLLSRGGELQTIASRGTVDLTAHIAEATVSCAAIESGSPQRLTDADDDQATPVWAIPVIFAERPLGVVVLAGRDVPSANSRRVLALFSQALAVSLTNALTHAHVEVLAQQDPLTGCANRRAGLLRLSEAIDTARTTGVGGVLIIDLDHFKRVNDTHGHAAGDQVLACAAAMIGRCLRSADMLVRYGGEEFLVILPDVDEDGLLVVAHRIRRTLEASPVQYEDQQIRVTASVGAVRISDVRTSSVEQLLEHADRALYRAKAAGRNRVMVADPEFV